MQSARPDLIDGGQRLIVGLAVAENQPEQKPREE